MRGRAYQTERPEGSRIRSHPPSIRKAMPTRSKGSMVSHSSVPVETTTFAVVFNREEASPQVVTSSDFSPQTPGAPGPTICFEATSVNFNGGNIFGSTNTKSLATAFSNGWSTFAFNDPAAAAVHRMVPNSTVAIDLAAATTANSTVTYFGLPVVGFAAETFQNDAIVINGKSYLSTFGVTFVHHKTTKIQ